MAEGRWEAGKQRQCQPDTGMGRVGHATETLWPSRCGFAFSLPFFSFFMKDPFIKHIFITKEKGPVERGKLKIGGGGGWR